jgi:hypothetical protein
VVGTHAAGTDAAERQVLGGEMQQGVVDGDPAGQGRAQDLLDLSAIMAEGIQRQWPVARVDERDRRVERIHAQHRQDRAEDLLAHQRQVRRRVEYQHRCEQPLRRIVRSGQHQYFAAACAGFVEIALQPGELAVIDDAAVIRCAVAHVAVACGDLSAQRLDQRIAARAADHQHIVGRDAGLAGVDPLACGQARGGALDRVVLAEDQRRLAAQFQGQRGQVRRGGGHDLAPDRGRTGEHQVVEWQRGERAGQFGAAIGDGHARGREHLGQ